MPATVAGIHLGPDTHANRPAANTAGLPDGALYLCSTHNLIYIANHAGNSWSTWATLDSGGIADHVAFTYLDATDGAAPADPTAGYARIYSKSGRFYSRDPGGVEYGPFDAGGGAAAPTLYYVNGATWAANSDTFQGPSLGGQWTALGSPTLTFPTPDCKIPTVAAGNCLDMGALGSGKGIYQAVPATPWKAVLGFSFKHVSAGTSMFGIFADNGTTQRGVGFYTADGSIYAPLGAGSYGYDGTHTAGGFGTFQGYGVTPWMGAVIYRIGSTDNHALTIELSIDGGASFVASTTSPYATGLTITRIFIGCIFGTAANPQLLFFNWE